MAVFTVQDDGQGISPDVLPTIFTPICEARRTPPTPGGTWASACRSACPSSKPTAASCPPPTPRRAAPSSASPCRWRNSLWRIQAMKIKEKILIIEDEANISSFIAAVLEANDYDTMTSPTGSKAITMITSHLPGPDPAGSGSSGHGRHQHHPVRPESGPPAPSSSSPPAPRAGQGGGPGRRGRTTTSSSPSARSELLARIRTAIRHTRYPPAQRQHRPVRPVQGHGPGHRLRQAPGPGGRPKRPPDSERVQLVSLLGKYAGRVLTYDFIIRQLWGPKAKSDNQILHTRSRVPQKD